MGREWRLDRALPRHRLRPPAGGADFLGPDTVPPIASSGLPLVGKQFSPRSCVQRPEARSPRQNESYCWRAISFLLSQRDVVSPPFDPRGLTPAADPTGNPRCPAPGLPPVEVPEGLSKCFFYGLKFVPADCGRPQNHQSWPERR